MKIVLAVFVLLDIILLAHTLTNYTGEFTSSPSWQGAESPLGNCTAREMWNIQTTCSTPAIHGLQKKKACMPLTEQYVKCTFDLYNSSRCFTLDDIQGSFDAFLNGTANSLCIKAMLIDHVIYQFDKVKGGTRYSFPCSISEGKFVGEFKKCNSKMLKMWGNNTADPRICREYFNTKQCKKQLIDAKCNYTGETKTYNDLLLGSYNPFCPGGVDFTSGTDYCTPFGTIALTAMLLLAILISQQ